MCSMLSFCLYCKQLFSSLANTTSTLTNSLSFVPPPFLYASVSPSSAMPSTVRALLLGPSGVASPEWFIVFPDFFECSQLLRLPRSPPHFHHWDITVPFTGLTSTDHCAGLADMFCHVPWQQESEFDRCGFLKTDKISVQKLQKFLSSDHRIVAWQKTAFS